MSRVIGQCKLCKLDQQQLCKSHIVPKFLLANLIDANRQIMEINGLGNRRTRQVQDGSKDYLLCEKCEDLRNQHYEKPFKRMWIDSSPLPNPWPEGLEYLDIKVDYTSFKIFHLSVFFLASVCTLPEYSRISLGPHEEKIRLMILNGTPKKDWDYPILGCAIFQHKRRDIVRHISLGGEYDFNGHRWWSMIYGGVEWFIKFSSHRDNTFEVAQLRDNGCIAIYSTPDVNVPAIQMAARMIRGEPINF